MDPYTEKKLIDEVLYLHSLWHQGPPNPNPTTNNTNPTKGSIKIGLNAKNKKIKKKKIEKKHDYKWPCHEINQHLDSSSGWNVINPAETKPVRVLTTQEKNLLNGIQLQQKALKVSREFFAENEDSDGDICSDDDSDDEDDDMMDEDGNPIYNFFVKVFEEDSELRGYYENNNENGEFSCLVCGGIGEKVGKKFKNCVALVQHSLSIAKTKKRKAHRAYSQVICKVLGWDINRLPSMPLPADKKPDETKENVEVAINSLTNYNEDTALVDVDRKDSNVIEDDKLPSEENVEVAINSLTNYNEDTALVNVDRKDSNVIEDDKLPSEGNLDASAWNIKICNTDTVLSNTDSGEPNSKENDIGKFVDVPNCIDPNIADDVDDNMMLCESSLELENAHKCLGSTDNGVPYTDGNSSGVVNNLTSNVAKLTVFEAK